jgi:N-acetyltransferase
MDFDLQPTLTGQLVSLRPLVSADLEPLFAVASDPLIWELHPASDRYQRPVFEEYFKGGLACGGAFLITDSRTGEVIGSSRYFGLDPEKSEIEIGWTFLIRSRWGGDFNRELKRLMLQHALQFVQSVIFKVGIKNLRSQGAMEKIGGFRDGSTFDDQGRESVVFRITRDSFQSGPLSEL